MKKILVVFFSAIIFFFLANSPVFANKTLFQDDFSQGSNKWEVLSGEWETKNEEYVTHIVGKHLASATLAGDSEWKDYSLELDIWMDKGVDLGIWFRAAGSGNKYSLNPRFEGAPSGPNLRLWKRADENPPVLLQEVPYSFTHNRWYKIKVSIQEFHIQVWVDNDLVINLTDPNPNKTLSQGKIGLQGWSGNNNEIIGRFDNIIVTEIPSEEEKLPIVILPGLGASWNHEAMLLGVEKKPEEWYMTPGIKVYDGLIQALQKAGYNLGRNLFIFNYNWTQPISSIVNDLEEYINRVVKPPPETKINLIGHSLGGLVARAYIQSKPTKHQVNQLITVGSPHKGVSKVYYLWEGGDLNKTLRGWQRIAAGLLLHLRTPGFSTTAEAIHSTVPSLKDLLPTFPFLKQNGSEKPIENMIERNDWLTILNSSFSPQLAENLSTVVGSSFDTLRWIGVEEPDWLAKSMNIWVDGKPTGEEEFAKGDKTVLAESAQLEGINVVELKNVDHRELIETTAGQKAILNLLGETPTEIASLAGVNYEPSLVFYIASPATLFVADPQGNPTGYGDKKMIVVPGATEGKYQIKITGTGSGKYDLFIGQITKDKDVWTTIAGVIRPGEEINYQINFNPLNPLDYPLLDTLGDYYSSSAKTKLTSLRDYIISADFHRSTKRVSLRHINQIIRLLDRKKFKKAIIRLYRLRQLLNYRQSQGRLPESNNCYIKNKIIKIINDLEKAYVTSQDNQGKTYPSSRLNRDIYLAERYFEKMTRKLKKLADQGKAKPTYGSLYSLASEKLKKARSLAGYQAHINALGARYLSLEGRKVIK